MQRSLGILLAAGVLGLFSSPAVAQSPVPNTDMMAVGFTAGASVPNDDALDHGAEVGVQIERYLSPRVSIRGKFSGAWTDILGRQFTGTIHPIAIEGNLVHNWEGGAWHPYATAGVGFYHYSFTEAGLDSSDNKIGVNLGGGAEYFFTRRDTLLGEALVRLVPGRTHSVRSDYETGYWSVMLGYKKYF